MEIHSYLPAKQIAFQTAIDQLKMLDVQMVCERTETQYDQDLEQYKVLFFGTEARIHSQTGAMEWRLPISWIFHILLLHYLIYADGSRPAGNWITLYEAAPNGSTRVNQMLQTNIPPLIRTFADDLDTLFTSASQLGGKKVSENTVELLILPHLPIQITVWPKDDEFPADARILLDKTVRGQLTSEDIVYVPDLAVQSLVRASGKDYSFPSV